METASTAHASGVAGGAEGAAAGEEAPGGHFVPSVVIGIAYYKSGQNKEKIHSQIPMVYNLCAEYGVVGLEAVEEQDHERGHAAKPVQYLVSGL